MKNLSIISAGSLGAAAPVGTPCPEPACWKAPDEGASVTYQQIKSYIESLQARNFVEGSIRKYSRDLSAFYKFLPEEKKITRSTLGEWRAELLERGYAPSTINAMISAVNSFLACWVGGSTSC